MKPDNEAGAEDTPEYESGPFCPHWGEPGACENECLRETCKHPCMTHSMSNGRCGVDGCPCTAMVMKERFGDGTVEYTGGS